MLFGAGICAMVRASWQPMKTRVVIDSLFSEECHTLLTSMLTPEVVALPIQDIYQHIQERMQGVDRVYIRYRPDRTAYVVCTAQKPCAYIVHGNAHYILTSASKLVTVDEYNKQERERVQTMTFDSSCCVQDEVAACISFLRDNERYIDNEAVTWMNKNDISLHNSEKVYTIVVRADKPLHDNMLRQVSHIEADCKKKGKRLRRVDTRFDHQIVVEAL
jgi:hypothetical protein